MKKLFIAALLTVTVATTAFSADEKKISGKIMDNFNSEFAEANNVKWTLKQNYVKASFVMDGQKTDAFYDLNGESIGLSRNITLESLPVNSKRIFAKKYSEYTVKEAIKFEGVSETAYFISAENEKVSLILKVTDAGVSVFKKTNKK